MRLRESTILFFLFIPLLAQQPDVAPVESETRPQPEYGGPAILSRGAVSSLRGPSETVRFRPYITLSGEYDTGITPVLTRNGQVPNDASIGGNAEVGLIGYHRWKTASLGLDYRGGYHHYARNTYYNGSDQSLSLAYVKQATRRINFTLRESAGVSNRIFGTFGDFRIIDPVFSNRPTNELFDGRVLYLSTLGDLTYNKSARLSFNIGGDGFVVRRRSTALYGETGYRTRGDLAYRTSRYATTGVAYDFTHFEFTKGFGATDIHTVQVVQSFRIGRYWELALRAGGSRVESLSLTAVTIDPVIAAIIGKSSGVEALYRVNWVPTSNLTLTRKFRRSALSFSYQRGITPGNGLYLTSRQENAGANFTYTGIRKLNIGLDAGYTSYDSLTKTLGKYSGVFGGGGWTYALTKVLHVVNRYDYRHYDVTQSGFKRNSYRASIGFSFSPGDIPLSLW